MSIPPDAAALLKLLQLASPTLPVGAYTYSEGLETLVQREVIRTAAEVHHWLGQALTGGSIRIEAAVMVRSHRAMVNQDGEMLAHWNHWLSATRETAELRAQSWQMGRSLIRLVTQLYPDLAPQLLTAQPHQPAESWNFAVAFGLTAAHWQISEFAALLGYLQSWATNLINAAVKLVPLGQTTGQRLLIDLTAQLETAADEILNLLDDSLFSSGWGFAIASMQHETLYSRLFRS
ncbi:MAG: urease accessory protein UreF [Cyanobacteria bacterium J06635_15]